MNSNASSALSQKEKANRDAQAVRKPGGAAKAGPRGPAGAAGALNQNHFQEELKTVPEEERSFENTLQRSAMGSGPRREDGDPFAIEGRNLGSG